MVDIDDLLFKGSIIIRSDKDNNIVGISLIKLDRGCCPIELSNNDLAFIHKYKLIMNKLNNGNKIYIYNGNMYLGYNEFVGPYAEEEIFNSFYDSSSLYFYSMLNILEYKLVNNKVKKKILVRVGDYYTLSNNKY